ncbi:MAG: hypothetical protein JWQ69_396 [Pseudomonas sp.]|nr:hypothetical protein [Pseudomonas sp.]
MTESLKDNSTQALPECLPAPVFPLANEHNAINAKSKIATPLGVTQYAGMQVGDIMSVHLIGFDKLVEGELIEAADFKQAHLILEHNIHKGFDFFIPGRILYAIGYGRAEAYMEVTRSGVTCRSSTAHVLVDMREGSELLP